MNRSMRDGGGSRSRMGMGDYGGSMRNYNTQGGSNYSSQGVLGTSPTGLLGHGLGGGGGGFGSGAGGSSYEVDSLLQQRTLQQQLSLRESQLALANSLLQQQQSSLMDGPGMGMRGGPGIGIGGLGSGMMMNKRRPDLRHGDYQPDFKRPRNDFRSHSYSQPRDRYRGRDSDGGNRGFNSRRNQSSSSSSRPYRSDRDTSGKGRKDSKEEYDPEKPTADEDEKRDEGGDQFHCHVCNVNCRDDEGFRRHMNSTRHKNRMLGVLSIHEEKVSQIASRMKAEKHLRHLEDEDKSARGFCKICDVVLQNTRYPEHQRMTFHRKRVMQVTKGCGWCNVSSFKNFTEVLAHRETEEHKKNQAEHEKTDGKNRNRRDSDRRGDRTDKPVVKKRAPIKVEMPANLAKFDPEVAVGQSCVIPVSGFFCKLCNKFYNNETAAKETHCKTEPHFGKYKRFIYDKLRAKAEEERDAEEKAQEEEEKKKAAAAAKDKDGEKGENGTSEINSSLEESKEGQGDTQDDEAMEDDEGKEEDEEELDEDDQEEGGAEEDESAMLAAESSALDFGEDADMEDESLLNETEDNNASYHTADDTALGDVGGEDVDESGVSIITSETASQFLQDTTQEDSLADDAEATLGDEEDESEDAMKKRATRATVNSPRARGRGRGASVNKARRGRKMTK